MTRRALIVACLFGFRVVWGVVLAMGMAALLAVAVSLGIDASMVGESFARFGLTFGAAFVATPPAAVGTHPIRSSGRAGSPAFSAGAYSVRPRAGVLSSLFGSSSAEYDIDAIADAGRFSFSFGTGILRREPNGPDLVSLQPGERSGLLGSRSYTIVDAGTGVVCGSVWPNGPDWEVRNDLGVAAGRVQQVRVGHLLVTYAGRMGDRDVCEYTWGTQGLTAASAALDLAFSDHASPSDRTIMIALGPILERQARKASGATAY